MVPNINPRGQSFKGVTNYLLEGKRDEIDPERVEWTSTHNLPTDNIVTASKVMAWTDENREYIRNNWREDQGLSENFSGRSATSGNVYHYSLSWQGGQTFEREEMERAAHESIKCLGLQDHQYYMVAHGDTEHSHVHLVVNLAHPETGQIANNYQDMKNLDRWAHEYELETEIVCENRDKKYQAWEQDKNAFSDDDLSKSERRKLFSEHLTQAYQQSDSGVSFLHAVEEKWLELARSDAKRSGFVVVDNQGEVYGLTRLIDGARKKEVSALLKQVDINTLPNANELAKRRSQAFNELKNIQVAQENYDRDAQETKQQKNLIDAADKSAQAQIAFENRVAELFKSERIRILSAAKKSRAELWDNQQTKRKELETALRAKDSPKEADHRAYNQPFIDEQIKAKAALEKIEQSRLKSLIFRLREGEKITEAIEARQKNIDAATVRLNENVGGLTGSDKYKLKHLGDIQRQQREELNSKIEKELSFAREEAHEKAKAEQENAIINTSKASDEAVAQKQKTEEISMKKEKIPIEEISIEKEKMPRPGMSSRDEWELRGHHLMIMDELTKDPRRNEVREEISDEQFVKHTFYQSANEKAEQEGTEAENPPAQEPVNKDLTREEQKELLVQQYMGQQQENNNEFSYDNHQQESAVSEEFAGGAEPTEEERKAELVERQIEQAPTQEIEREHDGMERE